MTTKTPGQVLYEARWGSNDTWQHEAKRVHAEYEEQAAKVIAHHIATQEQGKDAGVDRHVLLAASRLEQVDESPDDARIVCEWANATLAAMSPASSGTDEGGQG